MPGRGGRGAAVVGERARLHTRREAEASSGGRGAADCEARAGRCRGSTSSRQRTWALLVVLLGSARVAATCVAALRRLQFCSINIRAVNILPVPLILCLTNLTASDC
eukprot:scaffold14700_cov72-Phaeocystis_antarctica.AAC.2